jgi:hypothetical protein
MMLPLVRWSRVLRALTGLWPLAVCLAGILVAWSFGSVFGLCPEAKARYAGAALQLAGIGTAVWAFRSVAEAVVGWFRELPGVIGSLNVVLGAATASATGRVHAAGVSVTPGRVAGVEDRLSALEQRMAGLESDLDERAKTLTRELAAMHQQLQDERQQRAVADEAARAISHAAERGHRLQVIGLVWLAIGVVLTSVPGEMGSLFWR